MRQARNRHPVANHIRDNLVGYVALFFALSGGAAYALDGSNTVFSDDIVNGEVRSRDLAANSIGSGRIADRQVKNADLSIGASSSNTIADGGVKGIDVDESTLTPTPLRTRVAQGGCEGNDPQDKMVKVGPVCIDRYEASIWSEPHGGVQYGISSDDYPCDDNGQDCTNIYARSVPGVTPSRSITWLQAQQALANSGKRLPTNAEWQMAVAGTPDGSPCNVSSASVADTGANAGCVSNWGANDMVGNLWEWVADWDEQASSCGGWQGDLACLGRGSGEASTRIPGALMRGGSLFNGPNAGPFAVEGRIEPSTASGPAAFVGLRGAR